MNIVQLSSINHDQSFPSALSVLRVAKGLASVVPTMLPSFADYLNAVLPGSHHCTMAIL